MAPASDRELGGRLTATVVPDPDPPAAGSCPGGAPTSSFDLCVFDLRSRTVVFDGGLLDVADPGVIAIPEGFEDLVRVFEKHRWLS